VLNTWENQPVQTALGALCEILRGLSPARRWQLCLTLFLMLFGGLAEMVSIGAVLPFLALLADPSALDRFPLVTDVFRAFGWGSETNAVITAVTLLLAATVGAGIVRLMLVWASTHFVLQVGHDIGVEIYARMLRQSYAFHVSRNTSEVVSGIEKVQVVVFAVLLPVIQGAVAAVVALFVVVALIAIDPQTALVAASFMGLIYVAVSIAIKHILKRNSVVLAQAHTARIRQVQEGLGGIRDILIDQSQAVFEEEFRRLDLSFRTAQAVNAFIVAAPRLVVEASGIALIALIAMYMSEAPGGVTSAIPVLGAMALGTQRLLPLLQQVYLGWSSFFGAGQVLIDVDALRKAPITSTRPRHKTAPVQPFLRDIQLENVSFTYPGADTPALSQVDLCIAKGERIGFLGKTGSGKSTALDLIMGLLEPSEGTIRIDGVPLDDGNRAAWQAQIAHVPQFIYLADTTIAANIAFGADPGDIDEDQIREAARKAQLAEFIETLPKQYQTFVGEHGVRLSGGQRQRIGLARALYKQAHVLVLDEATSALDGTTEKSVMQAIESLGSEITVLMIAHRVSTLSSCDRVFEISNGALVRVSSPIKLTCPGFF
jgi:ABC-type multidrug transport system fused ATPase/permease subunit